MSDLRIFTNWTAPSHDHRSEIDATFGKLGIQVEELWLTAFRNAKGEQGDMLYVPAYPLAEWIADNFWSLLYEPRKSDEFHEDNEFRSRHWLGSARDGFVLPDIWIYKVDRRLSEILSNPAEFPHARLALPNSCREQSDLSTLESSLRSFVGRVVRRLRTVGIGDTHLHEIWRAITGITAEERRYCELVGSMGLSPFEEHSEIDAALNRIAKSLGDDLVAELCEAATEIDFGQASADASKSVHKMEEQPILNLSKLFKVEMSEEWDYGPPWRAGKEAAEAARSAFELSSTDPSGSFRIFEQLGLDEVVDGSGEYDLEEIVLHGSVRREGSEAQMALLQRQVASRRFDAARSCYLAWRLQKNGCRFATRARVRDQQASRAFAAELLAPADYLRSRASNALMSSYRVAEIADELQVSPRVVVHQARNNDIHVAGM